MSGGRRVLLVDDNLDSCESLAQLLELSGHEVKTAPDGPAALRLAEEMKPEIVVCDLGLPGMSGYEVARELRSRAWGAGMYLAALTGFGQDSDRERTREAGFDIHLVKPVDPLHLETLIDRVPRQAT